MEEILNNITLLLSNGLSTYIIYRYMHVFFEKRVVDKKVAVLMYAIQYIISAFVLVWIPYPMVNVFIALLCYGMIAWCYEGIFWKKISVVSIGYLTGFVVELFIMFMVSKESVPLMEKRHFDAYITVVIQCIIWIIVLVIDNFLKHIQKKENIPISFAVAIVGEMVMIITLEFLIFQQNGINNTIRIASVVVVTFILLIIVYLYASLATIAEEQTKNQMIKREKDYYHEQAELLQNNSEELREFRHDLKNKMLVLHELLEKNETKEAVNYLQKLTERIEQVRTYSQSGNIVIDSIINYKLNQAEKQGCCIQTEIFLLSKILLEEDDLIVVIGNLLDNAIEATGKLKENKYIQLKIKYDRECLLVKVVNSFDSYVTVKNGKLQTRKAKQEFHGIGLQSVQNVVEKYQGELKLTYQEKMFSVGVVMYSVEADNGDAKKIKL